MAAFWPEWTYHISWLYTNPASYNLWSSTWGELLLKAPLLVWAYRHINCKVTGCWRPGHPVHGTGYRACRRHHPAANDGGLTTAEEIAEAHRQATS